jgi:monothiol glutaredoxin
MQRPGCLHIGSAVQHVLQMVRKFAADIDQSEAGKIRRLRRQEGGENGGHDLLGYGERKFKLKKKRCRISCADGTLSDSTHMNIKAYLKPHCGWSNGVRAIMAKYKLQFEDIDIINQRSNYEEMVRKSGQSLSPCVEVDGVMLADISGEEVENYLLANNLVKASGTKPAVATNAGCSADEHDSMAAKPVRFF